MGKSAVIIIAAVRAAYISVPFDITTASRLDLDTHCRLLVCPQCLTNLPKGDLAVSRAWGFDWHVSQYGCVILIVADMAIAWDALPFRFQVLEVRYNALHACVCVRRIHTVPQAIRTSDAPVLWANSRFRVDSTNGSVHPSAGCIHVVPRPLTPLGAVLGLYQPFASPSQCSAHL
ncbi:hypothetical protein SCLCIDRAFT_27800 [Scleroderma citrinum Foug A]|uniref:Uncharacterized protein n=1 Tax=Scleroderma citrinum Foug A TaxID=1036808 RepID=A0A0C3DS30_9AGAM|nr:hypothetical protein SCLCIDRAFT_27800 [Scleroderma citrinum Foug A]